MVVGKHRTAVGESAPLLDQGSKRERRAIGDLPRAERSNSGDNASGVTSRPVSPVPPVEMMTSTSSRAIHGSTAARMFAMPLGTMISDAVARLDHWLDGVRAAAGRAERKSSGSLGLGGNSMAGAACPDPCLS